MSRFTSAISSLLGVLMAALSRVGLAPHKTPTAKVHRPRIRTLQGPVGERDTELPEDAALPALAKFRAAGLAGAILGLGLDVDPDRLRLRGYSRADRATLEARVGPQHFAVKVYAEDPASEAALYEALAAAGLSTGLGVRVPPLLTWARDLNVLVIGWLEGQPVNKLVKEGQPERAGELAARWLRLAASLPVRLGPPTGAARVLDEAGRFVAMLDAGDPALGDAGRELVELLARTQPTEGTPHLVHGSLYNRHLIDMGGGGGPGVIDWQRFGQGPLELDAGTFLATVSRPALLRERRVDDAARVEAALLAGTEGLLDRRAVTWHRAAALLRLAGRMLLRRPPAKAQLLLREATRLAEATR